jgi:DGQHR domain-containing protein
MIIRGLKVNQWLSSWDDVAWNELKGRGRPDKGFFLISISANVLRKLSGVYRRETSQRKSGADESGIQRKHDPERSSTIREYVQNGYPWSELSAQKRRLEDFNEFKKPGWLPTAIVLNILKPGDKRRGKEVSSSDLINVAEGDNGTVEITLPQNFNTQNWSYEVLPPIEIIDGQHRLWAFDGEELDGDFELPVVAFHGLGLSWQAYMFYTINITPKKINKSLAYDLYPMLRTEDWLDKFDGHIIYRETRAQELVDLLYSHNKSPWYQWIDMLGDGGRNMVSQASWIRNLLATFVRSWEGPGVKIGGLFGAPVGEHETVLSWGKAEQTAILIYIGAQFREALKKSEEEWIKALTPPILSEPIETMPNKNAKPLIEPVFYGKDTLINQDQGIRAMLHVLNDYLFLLSDDLKLADWYLEDGVGDDIEQINQAIDSLSRFTVFQDFVDKLIGILITYDWRSSKAPGLSDSQSLKKAAFRGSGGYKELRKDLLRHIEQNSASGHLLVSIANKILTKIN